MCRFAFYVGPAMSLASLITDPEHSLIRQSFRSGEREEPLNGDGFGVAWYPPAPAREPALFRAVTPAWNNANLVSLARAVKSGCILAHVRAATQIRTISESNCHPFVAGHFAFMHNGDLGGFAKLRRRLLSRLGDESFGIVQGQTDSEHLFALFLEHAGGPLAELDTDGMAAALSATIKEALAMTRRYGDDEPSYLNVAVTNGTTSAVTRYTTDTSYDGESLYLNVGRRYVCEDGVCRMVTPDAHGHAVIVSSERLSKDPGWEAVPANHMVLIAQDRTTTTRAIEE
jgi:predicted glutamine amidotransferase